MRRRSRSRTARRFGRRSRSRSAFRFGRCSRSRPALRFSAALSLRSARRFGAAFRFAALSLALGLPRCGCGAPAHARFAASGGAPARARLSALRRFSALLCSRSRPARRVVAALQRRTGGFYLINIYLNIIINQSRRRREAPAFRTAKKYAPSGGVFPLSDIYFCFAYSAIALYFSKSSGRRMRALAGLVEGSSMHGMQPQGSQNRL